MPSKYINLFTVFVVAFKIQVIIDERIVINCFDIFLKLGVGGLEAR